MHLVKDGLWDIVQGTETISSTADEAARRKFESRRDLALATIVLGVDQSQLYLLGDPTDPVEVWRKLQNTFQKKLWVNKLRLKKKLFNMKFENGQNLQDYLKGFVKLFEELAIIGDAMEEEERVIILLSSLPDRLSTLVTAPEADEKMLSWKVVTEHLLNEERKQQVGPGTSDSSEKLLASFKRNKKFIKCFECGKEGHIKRQCRVYEERLRKENRTFQANRAVDAQSSCRGETTLLTSSLPIGNVDCDSWIVVSGATRHMCNKKSQFTSYSDLSSPVRIEVGDGRVLKGVGVGNVCLKVTLPNKQTKNEVFLEESVYTRALLSRFGMDNGNSVATPVDLNADLLTTQDEVEECDRLVPECYREWSCQITPYDRASSTLSVSALVVLFCISLWFLALEMERKKSTRVLKANLEAPNKRKVTSIYTKLKVLKTHQEGMNGKEISRVMGIPASTVRFIIKNGTKIKQSAKHVPVSATQTMKKPVHEMMSLIESMLFQWICDQRARSLPLSEHLIRTKALSLYAYLKSSADNKFDSIPNFAASRGWFAGYKRRFNMKNVLHGEAASSDSSSVAPFVKKFKHIITQGEYSPHQVFNVDETGLYWKKLPSRTIIIEAEKNAPGFKASQDRLTLLLGGNASGSVKLKPLLLYKLKNPRALKNVAHDSLPVIWKSNHKEWITKEEFIEWFRDYFVPFIEQFTKQENLDNKALLLLDNAPGHPPEELNDMFPHIQITFLPPNATSVLQPMDQGVIKAFKAYYLRDTMKGLVDETDKSVEGIKCYWKRFNIKTAIEIIKNSWNNVSSTTLNSAWKKLWPECVNEITEDSNNSEPIEAVKELATEAGFAELTSDHINEFLSSHEQELSIDELVAIHNNSEGDVIEILAEDLRNEVVAANERKKDLAEFLEVAEKLKRKASSVEVDAKKLRSFHQSIDALTSYYKDE
ncbi:DNA binding HTH domain Psq-type [Trinorchestia longiramus]|nr:DNA binding HTH domain Psq-type [Trinorchestia longiramus]